MSSQFPTDPFFFLFTNINAQNVLSATSPVRHQQETINKILI